MQIQSKDAEQNVGADQRNLIVANVAGTHDGARNEPLILGHLELVVNTANMDEVVQQCANNRILSGIAIEMTEDGQGWDERGGSMTLRPGRV